MAGARVRMDSPEVFAVKVFREGDTADRNIRRRADRVYAAAFLACPGPGSPVGPNTGPHRRTGALRNSLRVDQERHKGRFSFGYSVSIGGPSAPHWTYIINGTEEFDLPVRGRGYYQPGYAVYWWKSPRSPGPRKRSKGPINVPAREGNNFMEEALDAARIG